MWSTKAELLSRPATANVVGIVASTAAFGRVIPNGPFLEAYKNVYQAYRNMEPIALEAGTMRRIDAVLDDMHVDPDDRGLLRYFTVSTGDVFHAGTIGMRWGGAIGLPLTFNFQTPDDVPCSGFSVFGNEVDWNSSSGRRLAHSLVLSENAQKFAIARETVSVREPYLVADGTASCLSVLFIYMFGANLKQRMGFVGRPRLARVGLYSAVTAFGLVFWTAVKDQMQRYQDSKSDRLAASLGAGYARGAVEFYEKTMLRNSALRSLMSDQGEELYSTTGNYNYFIRMPCMSPSERLKQVRSILEELEQVPTSSVLTDSSEPQGGAALPA